MLKLTRPNIHKISHIAIAAMNRYAIHCLTVLGSVRFGIPSYTVDVSGVPSLITQKWAIGSRRAP
jgi:hypothetical protein